MSFVSLFFKKLKEKIGFRIMTKDEYELFLKEKRKSCFNSNMLGHSITSSAIDRSNVESNSINPATGLPISGGVDVGGNPYGVDLSSSFESTNPATGLPMSGGLDVGGNPYGVDLNSSFNHSFQDLSNSYHNDFHHD